jgi:hypothetical protein
MTMGAWARAASVASVPLLLYGCVAQRVVTDGDSPRRPVGVKAGRPGFVIAAPHGSSDVQAGEIATELARLTGFGLVVSAASTDVVQVYEKRVQEAAQGRLLFYVEIHGNARRGNANRIEIATVGVDAPFAARLRTLLELTRDVHLRGHAATPRLDVLVEPSAAGSPRDALLRLSPRALHLEVPPVARADARERYVAILADFLSQAATLPAGR